MTTFTICVQNPATACVCERVKTLFHPRNYATHLRGAHLENINPQKTKTKKNAQLKNYFWQKIDHIHIHTYYNLQPALVTYATM